MAHQQQNLCCKGAQHKIMCSDGLMWMQSFELDMRLDESLQQLQDSRPHRGHLDEPVEALTFDEFSKLFL